MFSFMIPYRWRFTISNKGFCEEHGPRLRGGTDWGIRELEVSLYGHRELEEILSKLEIVRSLNSKNFHFPWPRAQNLDYFWVQKLEGLGTRLKKVEQMSKIFHEHQPIHWLIYHILNTEYMEKRTLCI